MSNRPVIRVVIVDDEPHAREGIRLRLHEYREVNIVGEAESGPDAVRVITALKPDVVFLDIQLPEFGGFEVLQHLQVDPLPVIVFVTAFDQFAVRAFEVHALDYLLKPVNARRFRESVRRAIRTVRERHASGYSEMIRAMLESVGRDGGRGGSAPVYRSRIMVRTRDIVTVVPVEEIGWLESSGDYVTIHAQGHKHLVRETLSVLERELDPAQFVRVHRTAIVHVGHIRQLRATEHGDYEIVLKEGSAVRLGRTYRENFQKVMGRLG